MFRSSKPIVELAMRRFEQEKNGNGIFAASVEDGYYSVVKSFVAGGNRINDYNIARVEKSRYAFPLPILSQIEGETTMDGQSRQLACWLDNLLDFQHIICSGYLV